MVVVIMTYPGKRSITIKLPENNVVLINGLPCTFYRDVSDCRDATSHDALQVDLLTYFGGHVVEVKVIPSEVDAHHNQRWGVMRRF